VYVFSSKCDITSAEELNAAIARFQEFLELCEQDTAKAKNILAAATITPAEAEAIDQSGLCRFVVENSLEQIGCLESRTPPFLIRRTLSFWRACCFS
jgi:hypothetical protein